MVDRELKGEHLKGRLDELYGNTRWVTRFAKLVGLRRSTLYRYLKDEIAVPRWLSLIICLLEHAKEAGIPLPASLGDDDHGNLVFPVMRYCAYCPSRNLKEAEDAPLLRLVLPEQARGAGDGFENR